MELKLFKDFDNDITKKQTKTYGITVQGSKVYDQSMDHCHCSLKHQAPSGARQDLHPARKALDSLRSFQRFNWWDCFWIDLDFFFFLRRDFLLLLFAWVNVNAFQCTAFTNVYLSVLQDLQIIRGLIPQQSWVGRCSFAHDLNFSDFTFCKKENAGIQRYRCRSSFSALLTWKAQ